MAMPTRGGGAGRPPYTGRPVSLMSEPALLPFARRVLARPALWWQALAAGWSARARGSLLPVPEPRYWAWRLHTAYGGADPDPDDLADVLAWRRRMRRLGR